MSVYIVLFWLSGTQAISIFNYVSMNFEFFSISDRENHSRTHRAREKFHKPPRQGFLTNSGIYKITNMKKTIYTLFSLAAIAAAAFSQSITETDWGKTKDGTPVKLFTMKNDKGLTVKITNFGGRIVQILAPDRNGQFGDVVLGFDSLSRYDSPDHSYFGALIGRYGNRISEGEFSIDGKTYNINRT